MQCNVLAVILLGLLVPAAHAQTGGRLPVPEAAAIAEATKLVAEVYKQDYDAAKTALQKQALAHRLLDDAAKTRDDAAGRYALLDVARKIASGIGDIDTTMRAVEAMAQAFDINAAEQRKEAVKDLAPQAKTRTDHYALTRYIARIVQEQIDRNEFAVARELAVVALSSAKRSGDSDLVKQWQRRQEDLEALATAYEAAQPAFETLRQSPTDPAANAQAGRFLCFFKQDWEHGLPLLALAEASDLQKLAVRELKQPLPSEEKAALADAWFDVAQKLDGPEKVAALNYAGRRYRQILPTLSAIPKRRTELRLQEIAEAASPLPKGEWIEILDYVDLQRSDGKWNREGAWKREGVSYISDGRGGTYIAIPVAVDGSYEIEVTFTKLSGWEGLNMSLSHPANNVNFQLNSRGGKSGLARVEGRESVNQSGDWRVPRFPLDANRPCHLKIAVLRDGDKVAITATIHGKPYFRWSGNQSQLTEPEITQTPKRLEGRFVLGGWDTALAIHSVRIKTKDHPPQIVD